MSIQNLGAGSRIRYKEFGDGVVVQDGQQVYLVTFIKSGMREVPVDDPAIEIVEKVSPPTGMVSLADVERRLMKILQSWSDISEIVLLGDKWRNGLMILKPSDKDLASKEIKIDDFFHKIVMVRDRLRVLEQKVNASKGLSDEEKVDIQQYITRCYGSLTTFNLLFKNREQHFVGSKES